MRSHLRLPIISILLFALAAPSQAAPEKKPNIVVILVDDMGYSDIGCYGGEIKTPNLDKLAGEGVRFTQFHNTARCCPSRAALLTGLYPHQAGVGHMTDEQDDADGKPLPGYSGRLNDRCVTIPEALHGAGYFTAMTGKWHVGQNYGVTPWGRGFDRTLTCAQGGFYFPGTPVGGPLYLNGKNIGRTGAPLPATWYSTDLWTDYGLKFIDEARTAHKPFFLYLAHNAPHFALQAPAADIARWRGKFKAGWDKLREARYKRQIQMGLIDKSWPLSPRLPEVPAWDSLTPAQQDRYDHIMAIYAAVVEHMDKSVGTLIAGLKQRGELDNTLILFMSDNGGNAESGVQGRLEGANPGGPKSTVFVGQAWATLNNTPFVRYKHYTDEGGVATPLIAHWPNGIPKARDGRLETQPGHVIDIMATCLDVAGAAYPKTFHDHAITPIEGVSLRPAFAGKTIQRTQPIFWEHEGNRAVLASPWKLVAVDGKPWRLYNTAADRTEQHDLAGAQPDRVKLLATQWDAWAKRADVLPLHPENGVLSGETQFTLKEGDHLDRAHAPAVAGCGFTLTAKFDATGTDGVVAAQGGAAQGYTLFLQNGKLTFLVREAGHTTQIATPQSVTGAHTAVARVEADGVLSLTLDSQGIVKGKAPGPLPQTPIEGLDIGEDRGARVGPYGAANTFAGTIQSVIIELDSKPVD
ncbi:MAG: arylsulfatase [Capsulimonas sp.]|uniref:arylsulfatase n=1 Tax=Capsulimonas sp. TaxID=2494211 RepID=UPI00326587B7